MEQFRQIGEVLGSIKAQFALRDDNQINQRQCTLLFDLYNNAFNTIADEIKQHLRLEEKATKWKPLEQPLKDLIRVFKEGDSYIKTCSETKKSWWVRAIYLQNSKESVEYHIHNLMLYFPMVIEAIETAGEISGLDVEEMNKKRIMLATKYHKMWNDPKLFQWKYGKKYLVEDEITKRLHNVLLEDNWMLVEAIKRKKPVTKYEQHLGELLSKRLKDPGCLYTSSVFTAAKDYQVKRRIGKGSQYKEIQWLGDGFVLRRFFSEDQSLQSEIHKVLSLSHPNVVRYLCGFQDEDKNEYFLVMEQMIKDLNTYVKEQCGPKRRVTLSIPVAIDIMLQVARGMEYLHSNKIYHGDLNPSNVVIKVKNSSSEGFVHVKITGFDLKAIGNGPCAGTSLSQDETLAFIWNAPEVLAEQEKPEGGEKFKYTEKADVYSFSMLCFQVLTGKIPFEDTHLKGEKMSRNIRAGERPLFPFALPKYLATLIKRCWHGDPTQRPSFSSICRILRYMTRVMVTNPQFAYPLVSMPQVDVCDIEAQFLKKFPQKFDLGPVTAIPFQLFSYRLVETEKLRGNNKKEGCESASEGTLVDESNVIADKLFLPSPDTRSTRSENDDRLKRVSITTDDSLLASRSSRMLCSGPQEKTTPSISRSLSLTESDYEQQVQEMKSVPSEASKNKTSTLQKTSSLESMSFLCSDKKDFILTKCKSLKTSRDTGKPKATGRLSLQKPPGNLTRISEPARNKTLPKVSSSLRKPTRQSTDSNIR